MLTNKEAMTLLKSWRSEEYMSDLLVEAIDVAIKALEERQERPTAKWVFVSENHFDVLYSCTKCGRFFTMPKGKDNDVLKFAPYCRCGAKMINEV